MTPGRAISAQGHQERELPSTLLGPEHPDTLKSMNNLALDPPSARGDIEGAQGHQERRWRRARACSAPSIPTR